MCLIIFDATINIRQATKRIVATKSDEVAFCSLTSNISVTNALHAAVRQEYKSKNHKIRHLPMADIIDKEVTALSEKVSPWVANLSSYKVLGRAVKRWFLIGPEKKLSAWWLTLISDKNNFKTDLFLKLAQVEAIAKIIKDGYFKDVILYLNTDDIKQAIIDVCRNNGVPVTIPSVPKPYFSQSNKSVRSLPLKISLFRNAYESIKYLIACYHKSSTAKKILGPLTSQRFGNGSKIFMTHYPFMDKVAAENGTFANKLFAPLQERLGTSEDKPIWVALSIPSSNISYESELLYGKKIIEKGEAFSFLEEYLDWYDYISIAYRWVILCIEYFIFTLVAPKGFLTKGYFIKESEPLIKPTWEMSFIGYVGMEGLIFYHAFKKMFQLTENASHCTYLLEMHAWEKALNSAKTTVGSNTQTIGFQHTAISKNHLFYGLHKSELEPSKKQHTLPMPDVLACNGDIPLEHMQSFEAKNTIKVEAFRHLHIHKIISEKRVSAMKNIIVIAGSVSRKETKALVSMFHEAFPEPSGFQVWLKGHPLLSMQEILTSLNLSIDETNYIIKTENIHDLLSEAKAIFTGGSSVALDAMALGVNIVSPLLPDTIFTSPLKGHERFYTLASNPAELKEVIEKIMASNNSVDDIKEARQFIQKMWCLDPSLRRWSKLLELT